MGFRINEIWFPSSILVIGIRAQTQKFNIVPLIYLLNGERFCHQRDLLQKQSQRTNEIKEHAISPCPTLLETLSKGKI